jgi:DHA1 family bicyclomycin/chloramphenicol resistance-like MFS transporter
MGQGILAIAHWRAIFVALFAIAVIAAIWFMARQPETMPVGRRRPFSLGRVWKGVRETFGNRAAFGYTLAAGLIFGAFIGYLVSAQQILQQQYALGQQFALYFAVLSLAIGASALFNAKLVMTYGMRRLSTWSLVALSVVSVLFFFIAQAWAGDPPLSWFIAWCLLAFFCLGSLFGNFYALAMAPLGHIAGVAAAVIGSLTSLISLACGTVIGQSYDGTVLPLVAGFAVLGLASLLAMAWTSR